MNRAMLFLRNKGVRRVSLAAAFLLALVLAGPRTARAIAATLVQVTNTLSNPAVTLSEHKAASQLIQMVAPYGSAISPNAASPTVLAQYNVSTSNSGTSPYVVPAGQNLVITDLDFDLYGVSSNSDVGVLISNGNNTPVVFGQYYERFDFENIAPFTLEHISLQSGLVFPAGATVGVSLTGNLSYGTAVLRGYLTPQ